jgi:hypothetical protein
VIGSLNYLANTAIRELFGIRKLCKFTRMPGPRHYQALHHMLNHLRCYPSNPLTYFHDVHQSPLAHMLKEAGHEDVDPTFVYFTDSSFQDCDDMRSTGCYLGFLQGGLIDMSSAVPSIISHSTAEAETTYASAACLATFPTRRTLMFITHGDEERPLTVPLFTDSQSSIDIARNKKGTQRTKHMTRRSLYTREATQNGTMLLRHIKGKQYQLADIGTKGDIVFAEFDYKASIVEGSKFTPNVVLHTPRPALNQRGVMESANPDLSNPTSNETSALAAVSNRDQDDTGKIRTSGDLNIKRECGAIHSHVSDEDADVVRQTSTKATAKLNNKRGKI